MQFHPAFSTLDSAAFSYYCSDDYFTVDFQGNELIGDQKPLKFPWIEPFEGAYAYATGSTSCDVKPCFSQLPELRIVENVRDRNELIGCSTDGNQYTESIDLLGDQKQFKFPRIEPFEQDYATCSASCDIQPCYSQIPELRSIENVTDRNELIGCLTNRNQYIESIDLLGDQNPLKFPRIEPFEGEYATGTTSFDIHSCFSQIPELRSIENVHQHEEDQEAAPYETDHNLVAFTTLKQYSFEAIFRNSTSTSPLLDPRSLLTNKAPIPQSVLARQRRKKISDRTRYLEKLMPWDKKMDIATMLEEAYKYIKYLRAQVNALQSMPCESTSQVPITSVVVVDGGAFGALEQLNRQQLLQVLVNSPFAQTTLYSQECCVCAVE